MLIWSNSIYCSKCGGTNLHFSKVKEKRCKSGWTIKKICRQCLNEYRANLRNKNGECRGEKYQKYQKEYREKNREKVREYWRNHARKIRMRGRQFYTHSKSDIWDKYGTKIGYTGKKTGCLDCKQRENPHFAKGLCKKCYYKQYQKIFRARKRNEKRS